MSVQSTESSTNLNNTTNPEIRHDLVNTAVKFLANPRVLKTSLAEQQKFLKRKGLSDEEVRLACEKSGAYAYHESQQKASLAAPTLPASLPMNHQYYYGAPELSLFNKIKEIVHNIAIFSFVGFIEPFLFGRKKKSIEDSIQDLDTSFKSSISDLENSLVNVKVEVEKISQTAKDSTNRQISDLKSEIATVKGLLLSRSQFPIPSSKAINKRKLPSWQMPDSDDSDPERKGEEEEAGSGSGSSEHEHNTKNSDSSLEIISYASSKECDSDAQSHKNKDLDRESS